MFIDGVTVNVFVFKLSITIFGSSKKPWHWLRSDAPNAESDCQILVNILLLILLKISRGQDN